MDRTMRQEAIRNSRRRAERTGIWPGRGLVGAALGLMRCANMAMEENALGLEAAGNTQVAARVRSAITANLAAWRQAAALLHWIATCLRRAQHTREVEDTKSQRRDERRNEESTAARVRQKLHGLHHVALLSARNAREVLAVA